MKILVIWDVHGRKYWKDAVDNIEHDFVVFIWDYFDSWSISPDEQIRNFIDICDYQKKTKDVVLLIWNHDFHYNNTIWDAYSWYKIQYDDEIWDVIDDHRKHMQYVFELEWYLFSHAWVSKTWCEKIWWFDVVAINKCKDELMWYQREDMSWCWEHRAQSPIWIRPNALMDDAVEWYIHVVWHTTNIESPSWDFVFVDTPWYVRTIETETWYIEKVKA